MSKKQKREPVEGLLTVRKDGRVQAKFVSDQDAIEWLADKTGHTQETVAEETRGNGKLVDDAGAEWTVTVEGIA